MSARNRPRAGQNKDEADEERTIWSMLRTEGKRCDALIARSNEVTEQIVEMCKQQNAAEARGESSSQIDAALEKLLRENIRLCEEIQNQIGPDKNVSILDSLSVLGAIRNANETESRGNSASTGKLQRNLKRKPDSAFGNGSGNGSGGGSTNSNADDQLGVAIESPGGPSPKVLIERGPAGRLMGKASSRSGSVPAGREASVKAEDTESIDGAKTSFERHKLTYGAEVFYRNKGKGAEGEGILCSVANVIGEGKQRRYEIIDSDPDPPTPPIPYRASVNHLIAIPPSNANLPSLAVGKNVLALYPGTTTFYKAEVVATMRGSNKSFKKGDAESSGGNGGGVDNGGTPKSGGKGPGAHRSAGVSGNNNSSSNNNSTSNASSNSSSNTSSSSGANIKSDPSSSSTKEREKERDRDRDRDREKDKDKDSKEKDTKDTKDKHSTITTTTSNIPRGVGSSGSGTGPGSGSIPGVVGAKTELKQGWVRLRFEGEDEADREMDVERRFVLMDSSSR